MDVAGHDGRGSDESRWDAHEQVASETEAEVESARLVVHHREELNEHGVSIEDGMKKEVDTMVVVAQYLVVTRTGIEPNFDDHWMQLYPHCSH